MNENYAATYRAMGGDAPGCHTDEEMLLGKYATREEAKAAVENDIKLWIEQVGECDVNWDGDCFVTSRCQDEFIDASCEWRIFKCS